MEIKESHTKLMNYINELPLKYGQVLKLIYSDELSIGEVSQKLNIPPEEVSKRLWYGKQLIKKKYKDQDF